MNLVFFSEYKLSSWTLCNHPLEASNLYFFSFNYFFFTQTDALINVFFYLFIYFWEGLSYRSIIGFADKHGNNFAEAVLRPVRSEPFVSDSNQEVLMTCLSVLAT